MSGAQLVRTTASTAPRRTPSHSGSEYEDDSCAGGVLKHRFIKQDRRWSERNDSLEAKKVLPPTIPDNSELRDIYNYAKEFVGFQGQEQEQQQHSFAERYRNSRSASLRVYNLPLGATEEDIWALFSPHGTIAEIRIGTHTDCRVLFLFDVLQNRREISPRSRSRHPS